MRGIFMSAVAAAAVLAISQGSSYAQDTKKRGLQAKPKIDLTELDKEFQVSSEISAFDPVTGRLFVTDSDNEEVVVYSMSDEGLLTALSIPNAAPIPVGGEVTSVAVKNGLLAVAVVAEPATSNGSVRVYETDTLDEVDDSPISVGALPDMVTFTPDGLTLLVANEGEPDDDYVPDPDGSISCIPIEQGSFGTVGTATFQSFDTNDLKEAGVRIFGPGADAAADLEPEYIAVAPDGTTAYVSLQENNALAIVDVENCVVDEVVPLGVKDHSKWRNQLDANKDDGRPQLATHPVFGMYQPDAIAAFGWNGETYIVTANEGDAREYIVEDGDDEIEIFVEEADIEDLVLDESFFKANGDYAGKYRSFNKIGGLTATTATGDTDNDGDIDEVHIFGARSFSVWSSDGELIYDSGRLIEQITANQIGCIGGVGFNATDDDPECDDRSDNKGPEPEGVDVGFVEGRPFAFVGLERVGGIMVFDLSIPENPRFVQYLNQRNFSNDENDPYRAPEGVLFISASQSPTGNPLLVVTYEVSATVVVYEVSKSQVN